MKKRGIEIQYRTEVPLVAFLGDTTAGAVFDHPDVQTAQVLVTEVTFFESSHRAKAKVGKHLHVDHFVELLPKLRNEHIVLTHVSRRTGVPKARRLLAKRLSPEQMARIHFLMDFEGARDEGEVEDQAPPPSDTAE